MNQLPVETLATKLPDRKQNAKGWSTDRKPADGVDVDTTSKRSNEKRVSSTSTSRKPSKSRPAVHIERYQQFPTDVLPEPVRGFVTAAAKAIGCDASYIALPLLTALAAAIGNSRRIQLKRGWTEPAILWTAIVGDSGTMKSPALELALRPVRERQRRALAEYNEQVEEYRDASLRYDRDLLLWKRSKDGGDPPEKPDVPIADRYWCDDPTVEALALLLLNQWRGMLMVRDELAGWMASFDRYAQGKGGDVARWLEMFGGRSMMVDRKTGDPRTLFVPRAAVSVTGGIQPGTLRRCLGLEHRENGLAARLLLTYPPRRAKRWTEADIDPDAEAAIAGVLDGLYELQPRVDDDGEPQPVVIGLTPEGRRQWVRFYNEHAEEQVELTGDVSAAWSKLEGYAARLALVIHCTRLAANDPTLETPDAVDAESMKAGIRLSRWFGHEARRVYAILDESDEGREQRWLVELIQRKGGRVSCRDLQRSSRRFKSSDEAEAALKELAKADVGHWVPQPPSSKGGRPTQVFELFDMADVDTTSTESSENDGSVNVDSDHDPSDEWGEL